MSAFVVLPKSAVASLLKFDIQRESTLWTWVLAWLLAPALLFCTFWMRPVLGWPLDIAMLFGIACLRRQRVSDAWREAVLGIGIASIVLVVTGFVSGVYCWDWIKHWAVFNTIGDAPWPVQIGPVDRPLQLRYYVAAYLVPGGLHKLLPFVSIKIAAALGIGSGVALMMSALMRANPANRRVDRLVPAVLALFVTGLDFYGEYAFRLWYHLPVFNAFGYNCEWWATHAMSHLLQYPSILTALFWVPNQAIATVLVALMWSSLPERGGLRAPLLGYGALSLWSPFGMAGLFPLVVVQCVRRRADLRVPITAAVALAGTAFALAVVSYLTTDSPSMGLTLRRIVSNVTSIPAYAVFLAMSLAPVLLLLRRLAWDDPVLRVNLLVLLVLPLLEGDLPDPPMRLCLGPLAILALAAARVWWADLRSRAGFRIARGVLIALMCVPSVATEVAYQLTHARAYTVDDANDPSVEHWVVTFASTEDISFDQFLEACGWHYLPQYLTPHVPAIFGRDKP